MFSWTSYLPFVHTQTHYVKDGHLIVIWSWNISDIHWKIQEPAGERSTSWDGGWFFGNTGSWLLCCLALWELWQGTCHWQSRFHRGEPFPSTLLERDILREVVSSASSTKKDRAMAGKASKNMYYLQFFWTKWRQQTHARYKKLSQGKVHCSEKFKGLNIVKKWWCHKNLMCEILRFVEI